MHISLRLHELEYQVQEILEDFLFLFEHSTSDLNQKVAEFFHQVPSRSCLQGSKQIGFEEFLGLVGKSLPESLLFVW